jgi:general secretion pathway protein C
MQQNLQRFFPLVTIAFVVVLAVMCAKLTSQIIARSLWSPEVSTVSTSAQGESSARAEPLSTYRPITERNLFNSKPSRAPSAPTKTTDIDTPVETQPMPSVKLVLMGTTLGGASDLAIFEKEGKVEIFSVGEEVAPALKLVEVKADRAFVLSDGKRVEYLLFTERLASSTKGRTPPQARKAKSRRKSRSSRPSRASVSKASSSEFDASAIRKVGDNSWVIDRGQVEQSLDNMSQLITEVRVIPNLNADRQADGFKIFEVKPASIFARLGVRNGDIIKEVNGLQLNGIDQAYQALSALQSESSVQINLVRRNKPVTLTYEIR